MKDTDTEDINCKDAGGPGSGMPGVEGHGADGGGLLPVTGSGVEAFLASEAVRGIGKVYAAELVGRYGVEAVDILRDNPDSITDIPGLGSARLAEASQCLHDIKYPLDVLLFLYSCGVPDVYVQRIMRKYRSRTRAVVTTDPYRMVEEVWQLSFPIADRLGRALNIAPDDPRRLCGALLTAVKHYALDGHLFATPDEAIAYASRLTGVDPVKVAEAIPVVTAEGRLVNSRGGLYLPVYYRAERDGARRLLALASARLPKLPDRPLPTTDIHGHKYSPLQLEAISMAVNNPVMVLTGGPGSGKTTVLKGILDYFAAAGLTFTLVAPTGRAAKRMTALTGFPAQTIHRLLGYRQGEGYRHRTIKTDLLVIDEGSMLEQVLFDHLLEAVAPGTRLIITGDVDQLPAIGAGDVMRDLIRSATIPVARLTQNFRQEAGSDIAAGARAINSGFVPEASSHGALIIEEAQGAAAIHSRIISLVRDELPQRYGIRPTDIQVVTPQQMGSLGARQLNADLQQALNPEAAGVMRGSTSFRLGDPVMQTANSAERGLYNGEVGRVVGVNPDDRSIVVEFAGGRRSVYRRSELSELVLAYATTVHKLQGSEVPYMVMPVTLAHRPMLYRNLLYTGVSRAQNLCVLVGEPSALRHAVENTGAVNRHTNFGSRLAG